MGIHVTIKIDGFVKRPIAALCAIFLRISRTLNRAKDFSPLQLKVAQALILNFLLFRPKATFYETVKIDETIKIRAAAWVKTVVPAFFLVLLWYGCVFAQPFAPPAGQDGSSAIFMDDPALVGWAVDYTDYETGKRLEPTFKTPEKALGMSDGTSFDVVSLGEGGRITLIFDPPIENGDGWDFAVFANPYDDYFLELAYVEVSSNNEDFARFDSTSYTPDPVSSFGRVDAALVDGLAGKYRQGYGVPFDLSDLAEKDAVTDGRIDLSAIRYVRIVDIIGDGRDKDSHGNPIYDPYPTHGSAGFDLDAIGVSNGAPYPEGAVVDGRWPEAPEKEGEAGFDAHSGCFIQNVSTRNMP